MKDNKAKREVTETVKKDYVTNKLLLVFTLAFALLLFFTNISRMMKSTTSYLTAWNITKITSGVFIALFVVGIIMLIVERAKGIDTKYRLLSGKNISIASAIIAVVSTALAIVFSSTTLTLIYVFIPALVVLYIVYYSYQREFFMVALSSILSGVGIWLFKSDIVNSADMFVLIAVAVLVVLLAAFTIAVQVGKGSLKVFGREVSVFKSDAKYTLIYLTYLLSLLLLAAAFLAPDLAIYFIFGLIAYIVITGIYYTVKLI